MTACLCGLEIGHIASAVEILDVTPDHHDSELDPSHCVDRARDSSSVVDIELE